MIARKLDHVAVTVRDMERSLEFYCGLLGLERRGEHLLEGSEISQMVGKPTVRMNVVRLVCPETPDIQIDLQQYLKPPGKQSDSELGDVANSHICFEVDDVAKTVSDLKAKGVEFFSEPVQFDIEGEGIMRVVFFKDPDNYVLELMGYNQ